MVVEKKIKFPREPNKPYKPVKPVEPGKPVKPEEFIFVKNRIDISQTESLSSVVSKLPENCDFEKVFFLCDCENYDDDCHPSMYIDYESNNLERDPSYKKKIDYYNVFLAHYEKDVKFYNRSVGQYDRRMKVYEAKLAKYKKETAVYKKEKAEYDRQRKISDLYYHIERSKTIEKELKKEGVDVNDIEFNSDKV